ncbi:MAG TPA: PAS domain S-box protein, partial [Nitrospira sp.]|nr:PAS domain S-box protein [Nitrospira sp.]
MRIHLNERKLTLIGLSLGFCVLLGLAGYAFNRKLEQGTQRETVRELRVLIEDILLIQSGLWKAESGQRGFLLTHDPQFLGPYHSAVDELPSVMARLEQRTRNDPPTKRHLEVLLLVTDKRLEELRTTLNTAETNPTEAISMVRSRANKNMMDELAQIFAVILNQQYEKIEFADRQERQAADEASRTITWGITLVLMLVGGGTYRVIRDKKAQEQAELLTEQTRLLNLAPLMTRDGDGRILSWSHGYERLYGWTEKEAIGKTSHHLLQTQFSVPLDEINRVLSRDGTWSGELIHRRHDGTTVPVAVNWILLKEGRNRPTTIVEVNTDISELKAAQNAQAQSDARFRLLADNMSQFAWIADQKGWIHWYNQRWFDYTGTTLQEMEGWGWKMVHHPDHVARVVEKFSRCIETGEVWEDTFPLRGRDGQYRWFLSRAIPIRDAAGEILQWFGTNTDITAHKAVAEAQAFLAAIVTSSPDAILTKSVEGVVLTWNQGAEALFGYPQQDIVSRRVDLLVPEGLHDEEQKLRNRVLAGMMVEQFETQRLHRSGRLLEVSISMSPIVDQQHTIVGIAQIIRDISIRKQSEQALKQSEQF